MKIKSLGLRVLYKCQSIQRDYKVKRAINAKPKGGLYKGKDRKEKIIVSLTTFSKRISTVHICIKTLLNQSVKPDKIILYLGEDVADNEIGEELKKLCSYGLEISTGNIDIKPHKKYYFAMQQYPDDIIITVDDDIAYERDLIKKLLKGHELYPNAVICRRARIIRRNSDGCLLPYREWDLCKDVKMRERYDLLPTGCGGVLYPPHCLDEQVFNISEIKSLCLNMDDLWLRFMAVKKGTPVVLVDPFVRFMCELPTTQNCALFKTNLNGEQKNDECLKNLSNYLKYEIDKHV
jgi:hypothetical protein